MLGFKPFGISKLIFVIWNHPKFNWSIFKKTINQKILLSIDLQGKKKSIKKENNLLLGSKLTKKKMFACSYVFVCTLLYFHYLDGEIEFSFLNCFLWCESDLFSKSKNQDYLFQEHVHILFISINGPIYFCFFYKTLRISLIHLTYSTRAP